MPFEFKLAERSATIPLIGLYGVSGAGKTYSALMLARGLVGPKGRILMIDTESGRGQLYADRIPGGYMVGELSEPFTPERYRKAIIDGGKAADVLIIDSMSHEWEGVGGVRDMAARIEEKSGKPGLHCWIKPKSAHAHLMLTVLQCPCPLIVCLRAKHRSRQIKNAQGRTEILRDDFATPIQAEDFIFEMTVHAEIVADHTLRVTKCSHPDLEKVFVSGQMVSIETGEKLAEWCKGVTKPVTPSKKSEAPSPVASDSAEGPIPEPTTRGSSAQPSHWIDDLKRQLEADGSAEAVERTRNAYRERVKGGSKADQRYAMNMVEKRLKELADAG